MPRVETDTWKAVRRPFLSLVIAAAILSGLIAEPSRAEAAASIEVIAIPWGHIAIDGHSVSRSPYLGSLPFGRHVVVIERDDCCLPVREEVDLEPSHPTRELRVRLAPKPAAILLRAHGDTRDALVVVDERLRGSINEYAQAPLRIHFQQDPDGEYRSYSKEILLRVFVDGVPEWVQVLTVNAGTTQVVDVTLPLSG